VGHFPSIRAEPPAISGPRFLVKLRFMAAPCLAISLAFLVSLVAVCRGDEGPSLFPIRQNGKVGYIDSDGKIVIAARFAHDDSGADERFQEGLQPIRVGDKTGFLDASGQMAIEPQFGHAGGFSEGFAAARSIDSPSKWGYIDKTGRFVIPPSFDEAHKFSHQRALVVVEGKAGYIDTTGAFVIPPRYRSYSAEHSTFREGLASVEIDGRWGFIDPAGRSLIQPQFGGPSSFFEGLAAVRVGGESGMHSGFIDRTGAFAIAPHFSLAWRFSEGLARVRLATGGLGFIDKSGSLVFTVKEGKRAGEFSEGLVNIQIRNATDEKWGYINRAGKWVIEPRYQQADPFDRGLARVTIDYQIAYIDPTGRYVWGPDSGNEALAEKLRNQASPEEWRKTRSELLRLALLIDPTNPILREDSPVPDEEFIEALRGKVDAGSDPARQLLRLLLSHTPDPALVKLSPDTAAMQQAAMQEQAARALTALGDPFVLPTLRRWLSEALQDGVGNLPARQTVRCAVEGLGQFRDASSRALLEQLLTLPELELWTTESAVFAIAEMALPPSKPVLLDALTNEGLNERTHCAVAAALVRLDESAGRTFLLKSFGLYLDSLRQGQSKHYESRTALEFLGDAILIESLEAQAAAEPPGVIKNNINTLLELMRISALPVEKLGVVASKDGDSEISMRLQAIAEMGRRGGPELLPLLKTLQLAPEHYARTEWNRLLRQVSREAAHAIKRRHHR
jgi:hypothetical protein